MEQLFID